ncbi:MAG: DMT family transporter [Candidatus Bipolaricaulaceae bacterium]
MGYLAILGAAALWGLIGPVSRVALQEGLAPLEVAFFRAVLAWFPFAIQALWKWGFSLRPRDFFLYIPFGLVGISLFYASYQLSIARSGAALASVLLYTAPAWVVLLAPLVLRERLTVRKLLAVFLALLGAALISELGMVSLDPLGILFGLLSGFSYAFYYLFGKRFLAGHPTAHLFFFALPAGALALLPLVQFHAKSAVAWGALLFLALFSTYGAYSAYFAGLRRLPASRAAILSTLEPVVAFLVAHLWWKEAFTIPQAIGAFLILFASLLGSLPEGVAPKTQGAYSAKKGARWPWKWSWKGGVKP